MIPKDSANPAVNDLAVDFSNLTAEVEADVAQETQLDNEIAAADAEADSLDVPDSPFWGESNDEDVDSQSSEDLPSSSAPEAKKPNPSSAGTIKYKANGEEIEISLEEAQKKLALADGARKAFTEKQKLQKQYEQLSKEREELVKLKQAWDQLEALKDDPEKLAEVVFNKPYSEIEKEVYERRRLYEEATPEERQLLEYEARMRNLERDNARRAREMERKAQEAEQKEYSAKSTQLETAMQREFFKHNVVESKDPAVANQLKKMLWRQSVADLKDLSKRLPEGKLPGPKMIARVFEQNAKALKGFKSEVLNTELKTAVEQKKQSASEKAQLASTANYKSPDIDPKLAKLDPLRLFQQMTGRR